MRRLYPAHAYSAAPRAACYWPETVAAPPFAPADGEISTDVAVIGAGFTGLSAALHLAEDGADVTVLEAETPGWGASGRNGGFCCLGGAAASDAALARRVGAGGLQEYRTTERAAVVLTRDLIRQHGIDADTHSEGETLMAHSARAFAGFTGEARKVEAQYGVTPRLIPPEDLEGEGLRGPFHGAMTTPVGFALNPLKYTLGLARAARAAGAAIHGHTPVTGIRSDTGFTLSTPRGRIRARRLVVATNGYSADDLPPWLRARYLPVQSNVIVTRPLTGAEIAEQGWSSRQMCYDARFLLHYFRLMPDGRMLFGMRGGLGSSPRADARMHRRIRAHFEAMFPAWAHVETPWSWNGLLSIAPDLTPFAGPVPEMPGAYAALSFHGNGVAMGTYAGALLADLVQGRVPQRLYPQVMQAPPRRFRLGRLRRATLWPLYAYAAVTGG